MSNAKKAGLSILFLLFFVFTLLGGAMGVGAFAADTWSVTGMTLSSDGTTYTTTNNGRSTAVYNGSLTDVNTYECEFLYHNDTLNDSLAGGAFIAFQLYYSAKDFYISRMYLNLGSYYQSEKPFVRVQQHIDSMASYPVIGESARLTRTDGYEANEWIRFKVVLADGALVTYLNGQAVVSCAVSSDVSVTQVKLLGESDTIDIKNIRLSNTQVSYGEWMPNQNMTETGTDGVYTSSDSAEATLTYMKDDLAGKNTAELSFRFVEGSADGPNCYVAWQFYVTDTKYYIFKVLLNLGIDKLPQFYLGTYDKANFSYEDLYWSPFLTDEELQENTWHSMKIVFENENAVLFLDGELYEGVSGVGEVSWKKAIVNAYCVEAQIKDYTLSYSEVGWEPELWSVDGTWEETQEDGVTVYSNMNSLNDSSIIWYNGEDTGEYNTIEAEIRYGIPRRGDGGIHLQVNHSAGTHIFALSPNCDPVNPVVRMFDRNSTAVVPIFRREIKEGFGATTQEDWVKLKFVLDDDFLLCYVNDILAYKSFDFNGNVTWEKAGVNTFLCGASVRNIRFSYTQASYKDFGFVEFEFNDPRGVESMTAQRSTLSLEGGKLQIAVTGRNPVLSSPVIDEAPGLKYSMYMPLRNTFLVRMANGTSAQTLRLSFCTSEKEEWVSKEFAIIPDSGDYTYYFNVSDLQPEGYLRGFGFEFVGATSGTVSIDAITFEREDPIYDYAGTIASCVADREEKTVTVTGTAKEQYEGKTVTVWQTSPQNYTESLTFRDLVELGTATVENGQFTVNFPLMKKNSTQTQLSSYFLASIDGVKVSKVFYIENYQDFNDDPARFEVSVKKEANVLDYGAKGDGFTDDTAAIQAAIDAVSAAGGGRVVVPAGENSAEKRYVMTHIRLKSNMEFVIEEGAVLWQSQREEELNKTVPVRMRGFNTVTYGVNLDIDGLVWCHSWATVNLPFIFIDRCENVRITGGGTIRMNDTGNEEANPLTFNGRGDDIIGVGSRVMQLPLCVYSSSHVDITDLTIMRNSGWHCYTSFNNDLYIANIKEKDISACNGDGFTITSSKNVTIDRCFTFTSDDAVGICSSFRDDRGQFYRPTRPGEDNSTRNVTIRHSYLFGGFGISWMAFGAEASNAYHAEISNVEIYDCVLGGGLSTGSWTDDPFYGTSQTYTYTYEETGNNHTSVKDVYYHDNIYERAFLHSMAGYEEVLEMTNFVMADDIYTMATAATQFMNANFDKLAHNGEGFQDERTWVTGLSYWSERPAENGEVGTEVVGTKTSYTIDTLEVFTQDDYAGYIRTAGELFQGLHCEVSDEGVGCYQMKIDVRHTSGTVILFARNALTGEVLAEQTVSASDTFRTQTLKFTVLTRGTVQLGVRLVGEEGDTVYIDNANLSRDASSEMDASWLIKARESLALQVRTAKAIDGATYTEVSYAALQAAIDGAEAVLADETADKDALQNAYTALTNAINNLRKEEQTPDNPDNPDNPGEPGTDDPVEPGEPDDPAKPQGGCGSVVFGAMSGVVLALGAAAVVFAKRRK